MQMQCTTVLTGNLAALDLESINNLTGEFVSAATENRSQQGNQDSKDSQMQPLSTRQSLVLPGHAVQTASQTHALPWIWLLFTGIDKGSGVKNHRV